jgi:hypothetical protein
MCDAVRDYPHTGGRGCKPHRGSSAGIFKKAQNMKSQLHISQLLTFLDCGWLYKLVYLDGLRAKPAIATNVRGPGVHSTAEKDLRHKMATGELLTLEELQDTARDFAHALWDHTLEESGEFNLTKVETEKGLDLVKAETVDTTISLAELHHNVLAPIIQPIHIERKIVLELPGYPMDLGLTIDQQETRERGGWVRDIKTGKGMGLDAQTDPQLSLYAKGIEVIDGYVPPVAFDVLKTRKTPKIDWDKDILTGTCGPRRFEVLFNLIAAFFEAREKQIYLPCNPRSWKHSPAYCGFYNTCKYAI